MAKKQIYRLMTCDANGSKESEKLYVIAASRKSLREAIVNAIHEGIMSYGDEPCSKTEQVAQLRRDFSKEMRSVINSRLHGGVFAPSYDGEVM